jgi:hypothetical protein
MIFRRIIGTFLFTDIVQSSKLWRKHKNKMSKAILEHEKLVYKFSKKFKGIIVKSLGDSFMLFFRGKNSYTRALKFSYDFMKSIHKKPIKLGKDKLEFRVGASYGDALEHCSKIQGKKLYDYFGNAVNLASRMESVVASRGEIALSFFNNEKKWNPKEKHEVRDYRKGCIIPKIRKRSSRLISSYNCLPSEKLKGAKPVKVYVFKPYK